MGRKMKSVSNKENCSHQESERTIPLDSTHDTDIIECSILGQSNNNLINNKNWILKTPRDSQSPKTPHQTKQQKGGGNSLDMNYKSLRLSLKRTYGLGNDKKQQEKDELSFETPRSKDPSSVIKKMISTLKKTPDGPYLSKSKLQNIEHWLNENAVETVMTPPFANLSVTPLKSFNRRPSYQSKNNKEDEESSVDSEVEGVLRAVYGDDWKPKNIQPHSKTEPKKKPKSFFSPVSLKKNNETENFYSVRRNILGGKKLSFIEETNVENSFEDSIVSGINILNLDSSSSSIELVKDNILRSVLKENKYIDGKSVKSSSLKSSPLFLEKKKNSKITSLDKPKNQTASTKKKFTAGDTFKTPKKTFLASLSVSTPTSRCHPGAQYYKINFKSKKEELVCKLYKLFNSEVFDGKLPEDMSFSWNVKLRGTAGYCYNKRITKSNGEILRQSRIEFSSKIVDRADRLRDTMIHELCHASSWIIDGVLDGHGHVWSKWASIAMNRFPELPAIKRCHNYDIVSKYVYRCTCCGYSIKRHSKSINTERKRCGHCYGTFELLINKKRKGKGETPAFDTTRTLPTPNKFAIFVKENYHSVKATKINANHAEIMKALSQEYALHKNGSKSAKKFQ